VEDTDFFLPCWYKCIWIPSICLGHYRLMMSFSLGIHPNTVMTPAFPGTGKGVYLTLSYHLLTWRTMWVFVYSIVYSWVFSTSALLTFRAGSFFGVGACRVHCRIFFSIPTTRAPQNVSRHCQMFLGWHGGPLFWAPLDWDVLVDSGYWTISSRWVHWFSKGIATSSNPRLP
jgi:hypothetical protein